MAREPGDIGSEFGRIIRRALLVGLILFALALFALWRADSPRLERLRTALIDWVVPSVEIVSGPLASAAEIAENVEDFAEVYQQNKALRREIQILRAWRETAQQLERENAQLRALNNLKLGDRIGFVAGEVIADSGGPYAESALINIGARDGVTDGAAAVDGEGLVGRVAGVGERAARLLLLTDYASRTPVKVLPSGRRAILIGENADAPRLAFLGDLSGVAPGDRVATSGDGGVLPPDIPVGVVAVVGEREARVRLLADYERLEFVRVLRYRPSKRIDAPAGLILPQAAPQAAGGDER